jgi:chromosomal replication initiation ATPase DnaA
MKSPASPQLRLAISEYQTAVSYLARADNALQRAMDEEKKSAFVKSEALRRGIVSKRAEQADLVIIQDEVAKWYKIDAAMLWSRERTADLIEPRHLAMFFARHFTKHTVVVISQAFFRDHGMVTFAINSIEARLETEPDFRERLNALRDHLLSLGFSPRS